MTLPENTPTISPPSSAPLPMLAMALLFILLLGGGYWTLRDNLSAQRGNPGGAEESGVPPDSEYPNDHRQWEKPLFAIVLSGQMHGFVDKCGCSDPQFGGLPRRLNFVQSLKARNWDVVGVDLGEMAHLKGINKQNLLKYELTVKALSMMNYRAMGIGRDEMLSPLGEALVQIWDKKTTHPRPILLTLADAAPGKAYYEDLNTRQYEIIDTTKPKVGVINMVGPDLREELKGKEKFLSNQKELPEALKKFAEAGVQFGIILHHEYPVLDEKKYPKGSLKRLQAVDAERDEQARICAKFCADERKKNPKIPPIQLMMVLTEEPEPPTFMKRLGNGLPTNVVEIGHKGKYVGLVGVYADKSGGYRLQYQKVLMGPEWESPKGKEKDNHVIQLMEIYNEVLKQRNVLADAPRSPHPNQLEQNVKGLTATYVGSNACRSCHKEAFNVWKDSHHFKGTVTLEKAEYPSGRQYDPECMKCHTTGFAHPGGYNDPVPDLAAWKPGKNKAPVANILGHNMKLRGIGCESCHGPASEHVKIANQRQPTLEEMLRLNPYRPTPAESALEAIANKNLAQKKEYDALFTQRMEHLNRFCILCHDSENDVHWNDKGIIEKWIKGNIIHRTKPNNNGVVVPPAKKDGPAVKGVEPPPIVIELLEEKKK